MDLVSLMRLVFVSLAVVTVDAIGPTPKSISVSCGRSQCSRETRNTITGLARDLERRKDSSELHGLLYEDSPIPSVLLSLFGHTGCGDQYSASGADFEISSPDAALLIFPNGPCPLLGCMDSPSFDARQTAAKYPLEGRHSH